MWGILSLAGDPCSVSTSVAACGAGQVGRGGCGEAEQVGPGNGSGCPVSLSGAMLSKGPRHPTPSHSPHPRTSWETTGKATRQAGWASTGPTGPGLSRVRTPGRRAHLPPPGAERGRRDQMRTLRARGPMPLPTVRPENPDGTDSRSLPVQAQCQLTRPFRRPSLCSRLPPRSVSRTYD